MKITLIGSTRFRDAFERWNAHLSLQGHLVYSLPMFGRHLASELDAPKDPSQPLIDDETKQRLELLHFAKIDASDAVVVMNVGDYMGPSTRREIAWASMRGKEIYTIEDTYAMPDVRTNYILALGLHANVVAKLVID